jgi:thioredoxin-related protein
MNRIITGFVALLLVGSISARAGDKTKLKWRSFDSGLAEAKKTSKKIMLDIYTDWCGWCKRLDKDTYSNEKVVEYLNRRYVAIKLNAESNTKVSFGDSTYTETGLARSFGVGGYPTIMFFDSDAKPINRIPGYVNAEKFLPIIKFIGDDHYKSMTWQEYEQKDSSKATPGDGKKE